MEDRARAIEMAIALINRFEVAGKPMLQARPDTINAVAAAFHRYAVEELGQLRHAIGSWIWRGDLDIALAEHRRRAKELER